ncbi:hypothetical protein ACI7CM_23305 [Xanthobacter sp. AM33]|uniref:hypothetical protein n=1 Tax=Xanthobacter sp. AM33 TaxID=3380644 RepID=UPI0039BF8308
MALAEGWVKPQKVILRNAGGETAGGQLLGRWSGLPWAGIDATTGNEVDLWAAGIADPFELAIKVVDCAASLAEMICRTGALLVKSPVDIGFSPEEAAATRGGNVGLSSPRRPFRVAASAVLYVGAISPK